jgi:hypothetical protein
MRYVLALLGVLLALPSWAQVTVPGAIPVMITLPAGGGCTTSGTSILKGNGSGGCGNATAGTDYLAPASPIPSPTLTGVTTFSGSYLAHVTTQAGTTYTLASTDCGTKVLFTNASAVTVTLPNSLSIGCQIALAQYGASKVSVSAASGATLNSPHSYTGTYAEYSTIGVSVDQNSGGTAAVWAFTGDGS